MKKLEAGSHWRPRAVSFSTPGKFVSCGWLLAAIMVSAATVQAEMRSWTNVDGKPSKYEMEYVELDERHVRLRTAEGRVIRYPFHRLSTSDQDYVLSRSRKRGPSDGAAPKRPPEGKWALLVGVDRYENMADLQYCKSDIAQLRRRLLNLGFPDDHIVMLSDEAVDARLRPTRENIQYWLDRLLSGRITASDQRGLTPMPRLVGPSDQIVVAFSGHGVQLGGTSYFCPPGADLSRHAETMLPMPSVYRDLASVSKGLRLLLVDACRNVPRRRSADEVAEVSAFEVNNVPMGVYALSSCSAGQASLEDSTLRQGVFSYFLQAALAGAGATARRDGTATIRLNQVATYAIDKTMAYTGNVIKQKQTPHSISNIGGNPVLGVLRRSDRIGVDDIVSTEPAGSETELYQLDLGSVRPPALPLGWRGPAGLVTSDRAGFRTIGSNADAAVEATSPRINLRGDFFLELEVGGATSFQLTLVGDDGPDMVVSFRIQGGSWYFQLPDLKQRKFNRLGNPESRIASILRLERRAEVFTLIVNSDVTKKFDYRYDQFKNFKAIKLLINDNDLMLYDLRVGPLRRRVRTQQQRTISYLARAPEDSLPEGWRRVGQPVDMNQRLIAPTDKAKIRGDFFFEVDVYTKKSGLFAIKLNGREGDRPLKIPFNVNGKFLHFALPTVEDKYVRVGDVARIRLERKNDDFVLRVNGEAAHGWRGGGFGDFDGFQIDLVQFIPIDNFRIGPLEEGRSRP